MALLKIELVKEDDDCTYWKAKDDSGMDLIYQVSKGKLSNENSWWFGYLYDIVVCCINHKSMFVIRDVEYPYDIIQNPKSTERLFAICNQKILLRQMNFWRKLTKTEWEKIKELI